MSSSFRKSPLLSADNRTWSRLPAAPHCNTIHVVLDGQTPLVAQILDESVNGVAILTRLPGALEEGVSVQVRVNDENFPATVRTIQRRGIFHRLGLQWQS